MAATYASLTATSQVKVGAGKIKGIFVLTIKKQAFCLKLNT